MRVKNPALTAAQIGARLEIDGCGRLRWLRGNGLARAGGIAGRLLPSGYRQVSIGGRKLLAHRVVWLLAHGAWPDSYIDHINGDKDDNRPQNLREATPAQNSWNKAGVAGLTIHKKTGKYQVQLKRHGVSVYVGLFGSRADAERAYRAAAKELFGEWRDA